MVDRVIGTPDENNARVRRVVQAVKVDERFRYTSKDFRPYILQNVNETDVCLDCGRSSRECFNKIGTKASSLETLDVVDYEKYPNILCDLCAPIEEAGLKERYDKIICLAVLEHCYNPTVAAQNLMFMLKPGGTLYGYVPWLFRYHAPEDLHFQDYTRFSKDSLALMFAGASELVLFPHHGRVTTAINLLWPKLGRRLDKKPWLSKRLDILSPGPWESAQCSGYSFAVTK